MLVVATAMASGTIWPIVVTGQELEQTFSDQLAELKTKVDRLEAAVKVISSEKPMGKEAPSPAGGMDMKSQAGMGMEAGKGMEMNGQGDPASPSKKGMESKGMDMSGMAGKKGNAAMGDMSAMGGMEGSETAMVSSAIVPIDAAMIQMQTIKMKMMEMQVKMMEMQMKMKMMELN